MDPEIKNPKAKIGAFLLKKKLGFRALMDVIPLDASLVKGSHGRDVVPESEQPVVIGAGGGTGGEGGGCVWVDSGESKREELRGKN